MRPGPLEVRGVSSASSSQHQMYVRRHSKKTVGMTTPWLWFLLWLRQRNTPGVSGKIQSRRRNRLDRARTREARIAGNIEREDIKNSGREYRR